MRVEMVAGSPNISVSVDTDQLATILIDQPGSKVNVMNVAFIEDLGRAVEQLGPELKGVIITSGKHEQFLAGADLEQLLRASHPGEAIDLVRRLQRILNRLAEMPFPSVAAINGPALGGGLEVALACDYRVAAESNSGNLGLVEVSLGLIPAGGGTQRLPRLVGLSRALGLILVARRFNPRQAQKYGVIDEVVHPAVLLSAARAQLRRGKRRMHPRWSLLDQAAGHWPAIRSFMYRQAEKTVRKKTRGNYPAPPKALDAVCAGQEQGFGAGLAAEAVAFGQLASGPVARNLIHLFFATEALKKQQRAQSSEARLVDRVGIVGAGFMGAGIAQAVAVAGPCVRMRDVVPERVAGGLRTARDLTTSAGRKGRFSRAEVQSINSRLSGTTDLSGFRRAQLVIEATFEDREVKRAVIAELETVLSADAVIASNTSSLPIADLAAVAAHPERVVGMHFFSPVHKMPLLEVVQGHRSSSEAIATAVEMGRRMGKTVIVVQDCPGFYTTRVLAFMVQEAGQLFEQGASVEAIDRAMITFGFPVGPLALSDEVGLDVAAHVAGVMQDAYGDRFSATPAIQHLVESGRLGRKSKSGFYDYRGRKKKPDPAVYAYRAGAGQVLPQDLLQRRMVLMLVNEASLCLEEQIIASPRDGDVGAVMGIGWPPFLGGPFRYADTLGAASVADQLRQMENAYGRRFRAAAILGDMARTNRRFYP